MTRQRRPLARQLLYFGSVTANLPAAVEFTKRSELLRMCAELNRLREENERLAALAYRDPLTGLRNRRCFGERLNEELCRLRRSPGSLSVICIDVNGFKQLNDNHGHAAGDAALVALGRVLETMIRAEDIACRLGGDEFAVLLPDTDGPAAHIVAERIRAHMPALAAVGLGHRGLAIGVSSWAPGDDEVRLLSRADLEMYADKRSARDADVEAFGKAA
jgi:diguanylate cyclase (GGDEF)-like protein